jgi:hypothetical protein
MAIRKKVENRREGGSPKEQYDQGRGKFRKMSYNARSPTSK